MDVLGGLIFPINLFILLVGEFRGDEAGMTGDCMKLVGCGIAGEADFVSASSLMAIRPLPYFAAFVINSLAMKPSGMAVVAGKFTSRPSGDST